MAADLRVERPELTSLNRLVHEIIDGSVRRHTFSQWELELLLDLQTCRVRKSARPELLRRYVRAVQQHFSEGSLAPLRLSAFLDNENQRSRVAAKKAEAAVSQAG
jgi:hypothetical protein